MVSRKLTLLNVVVNLWFLLHLVPPLHGTEYKYATSREDVSCKSNDGDQPYHGILKSQFCATSKVGQMCQNDKYCGDDEICACNTKCESWRCVKGQRVNTQVNASGDACLPNPCDNNGTCHNNGTDGFRCTCKPEFIGNKCQFCAKGNGFNGTDCKTDIDECDIRDSCHYGTCVNTPGSYTCVCDEYWIGEKCDKRVVCAPDFCLNNGSCLFDSGFKCKCQKGYSGDNCENYSFCLEHNCQHGACLNGSCSCEEGFTGKQCETALDKCKERNITCENGGKCQPNNGTCRCKPGYKGKLCEDDIDDCLSSTCVHGSCKDLVNRYECNCDPKYTGKNCDIYQMDCTPDSCMNNGTCTSHGCKCAQGFEGRSCENMTCPFTNCSAGTAPGCDPVCNIPACKYDSFKCSLGVDPYKSCPISKCRRLAGDGVCIQQCNNENCLFDGGDCIETKPCKLETFCKSVYNDGQCDSKCNVKECGYDKSDCSSDSSSVPKIIPGKLVMEVESSMEDFQNNKRDFERSLSITLNSYVTVFSVEEKNKKTKRVRRSTTNTSNSLEVKLTMDNRNCQTQCFSTQQAARYLALKSSQGELHLPVKVGKVGSEPGTTVTGRPPMTPLWIALIVVLPLIAIGAIFKGRTMVTKLWRTEGSTGPREPPVGQESNELRNLREDVDEEGGFSKRQKLEINNMLDPSMTPFLNPSAPFLSTQVPSHDGYEHTLHYAAAYGHVDIIRQQRDLVDINIRDRLGRTALHIAVGVMRDAIVQQLLHSRAINIDMQDEEGNTPLMDAVKLQKNDYVEEFIHLGARVTLSNKQGKTALHIAAMVDNFNAARLLLQHNAKVDAQDTQMRTPLHLASSEDAYKTAIVLLTGFANRNASDIDDISPLLIAQRKDHKQMVMILSDNNSCSPHGMIPSPVTSSMSPAEVSPQPYPDIRPKLPILQASHSSKSRKRKQPNGKQTYLPPITTTTDNSRLWEYCLQEIPDWAATIPAHHQQQPMHQYQQPEQFNFIGTTPFDTPSPCVGESELSPFSDTIPCIMTPPQSWGTSSPQSIGSDEVA